MRPAVSLSTVLKKLKPVQTWDASLGQTYSVTQGSQSAGEMIVLHVLVKQGQVIEACFQAHGSGYTILCCEQACQQLKGQFLATLTLNKQAVIDACALPREKYQALVLLENAFLKFTKIAI